MLQFESSTDILDRYVAAMDEYATVETKSALDGRNSHYILVPKNKKKDKELSLIHISEPTRPY